MDSNDLWAATILGELLEREWLVLVNAKSRPAVADALAALLADDVHAGAELAEALIDHPGVADLLCDDDALEKLTRDTKPDDEDEDDSGALEDASSGALVDRDASSGVLEDRDASSDLLEDADESARSLTKKSAPIDLIPHPRSETDARVLRVFDAAAPKQSIVVVEKPDLGDEERYIPAPPLYFVIDLHPPGPVSRKELFEVFTQAWFKKAGFPKLCGRDVARGEVFFVGTPASETFLASRGVSKNPTYDTCYLATPSLEDGAPREPEDFALLLEAVRAATPSWKPSARVSPKAAAIDAVSIARVAEDLGGELRLVLEAPKEGFLGRSVWNLMHSIGLRWGDLDVFNWETEAEWSDAALFWVGTSTEPGYFLPEEIAEDKRYADLTFAMGVGSKPQPEAIAKAMIAFAGVVKEKLGGTLRTSRGEELDASAFVRAVVRLHADLEARGFPPGAPHTVELLGTLSV
jgi:hypothetical protein